jgi:hypothetical protein
MPNPTAICLRCGVLYHGWALKYIPGQCCSRCGTALVMLNGHEDQEVSREAERALRHSQIYANNPD